MKAAAIRVSRRRRAGIARFALCLFLSACGGGGGVADFTQAYEPLPADPGSPAPVTVLAGSGQVGRADGNAASPRATFDLPLGLAADTLGNVYVADSGNHRIRRVGTGGNTVTIAGSGARGFADATGASASFDTPSALAVDAAGQLLVADTGNNALRSVSPAGVVSTVSTAPLTLSAPLAVAADADGTVYVADSGHGRIVRLRAGEAATEVVAGLDRPAGLTLDAAGALYIADTGRHVIRRYAGGALSLYAGTGDTPGSSDNVQDPGSPARFNRPAGLVALPDGRIVVADTGNNALRSIDAAGLVNTYFNPTVSFTQPTGMAADGAGNVFISDTDANRILRLAPTTILTVLAGSGTSGGLAVGADGSYVVADTGGNVIRSISGGVSRVLAGSGVAGSANGTGSAARFNAPTSLVAGPGGVLYVADGGNQIRQVTSDGVVTGFAGTLETVRPDATYAINPVGLYRRADGQLFATSNSPTAIVRVDVKPGKVIAGYDGEPQRVGDETRYDNGAGVVDPNHAVNFRSLASLAVDLQGNAYVVDTGAHSVRVYLPGTGVNGSGGLVVTLAGTPDQSAGNRDGSGPAAAFDQPRGLLLDADGNLYVADTGNNAVRKIVIDRSGAYPVGIVTTLAGLPRPGNADGTGPAASFNNPQALAFDAAGRLVVLDGNNNLIRRITVDGQVSAVAALGVLGQIDGTGGAPSFGSPAGVAVGPDGTLYVADTGNDAIRTVRADGTVATLAGSGVEGRQDGRGASVSFANPGGVSVDAAGVVYVADTLNHLIRRIAADGTTTTIAGSGAAGFADGAAAAASFNNPTSLSVTADGALIVVADRGNQRIRRLTKSPSGGAWTVSTLAGSGLAGDADGTGAAASFSSPTGVALEANGDAVVADTANNRIRRVTAAGMVSTVAGTAASGKADGAAAAATFNRPQGIAVDRTGRIVVADTLNNLVRRIAADGTVSRVAGIAPPYTVDGQALTGQLTSETTPLNVPTALAVAADGTIFVANTGYHQIVKTGP